MTSKDSFFSKIVLLLCFAAMAYGNLVFYPRWEKPGTESNIAWDVEGYYWYLPSIFIFKDLKKQTFKDSILQKYRASGTDVFQHGFIDEGSGNYVMKYTSGMALLYLPAFVVGHISAHIFHFDADGFSAPYKLSLQIWGLLFSFLGLFYLRKLLKLFYSDKITGIVLFLLVFGSNYFNYASIDIGMSHTWLFTLYVFIILNTHYFYQTEKPKYAYRTGFLIGLASLIRPTEIISVLIPLLWGLENFKSLKDRFHFIVKHKNTFDIAALCILSVISIQIIYWKYVSGNWIVYSYQDQGFNFIRPHAIVYSWSYRAGWLRYSPMMILAFVGLLFYWKSGKNKLAIIIFFILNYYIVSAWNIWDYGGFSGRAMIQSYPILVFPIAAFLEILLRRKWSTIALAPFIVLFLYINIWFTYQAHIGGLVDAFGTTKEYYYKIVGRWTVNEEVMKLKDTDEFFEGSPKSKTLVYKNALNNSAEFCVTNEMHATEPITIAANLANKKWLRVEADFECFEKEWDLWLMPELVVKFTRDKKIEKEKFIRVGRFIGAYETKRIFMDVKVPEGRMDSIKISLYNTESNKKTCIKNLEVSTFDK